MIQVSFDLTAEQLATARVLTEQLQSVGGQGAILGQAFLLPESLEYGRADFYYLTAKQYYHIDKALREALAIKEDDQ